MRSYNGRSRGSRQQIADDCPVASVRPGLAFSRENVIQSVDRMSTPIAKDPVKNYITPGGLQRLRDELRFLLTRERPAVTAVVKMSLPPMTGPHWRGAR